MGVCMWSGVAIITASIDFCLVEKFPVILVLRGLFERLEGLGGAHLVDVAESDHVFGGDHAGEDLRAAGPHADGGDVELLIRRLVPGGGERRHAAEASGRDRTGEQGAVEEVASGKRCWFIRRASRIQIKVRIRFW